MSFPPFAARAFDGELCEGNAFECVERTMTLRKIDGPEPVPVERVAEVLAIHGA
jgi:hypothetical protein